MRLDLIQSVIRAPYSLVVCPSEIGSFCHPFAAHMMRGSAFTCCLVVWMSCSSYFIPSLEQMLICVCICMVVANHGRLEDAGTRSRSQKGGKCKRSSQTYT